MKEDAVSIDNEEDHYYDEDEEEEVAVYKEKPYEVILLCWWTSRSHKDYSREENETIEDLLGMMDFDSAPVKPTTPTTPTTPTGDLLCM